MTIEQLRYLCAIKDTGSINKAALVLHISQPSITQSIKNLEEELNCKLLTRTSKGAELTPAGRKFLDTGEVILKQFDDLQKFNNLQSFKNELIVASNAYRFVGMAISELIIRYAPFSEGLLVSFKEGSGTDTLKAVSSGEANIGFTGFSKGQKLEFQHIMKAKNLRYSMLSLHEYAVAVGKKNPLYYKEGNSVKIEEMKGFKRIALRPFKLDEELSKTPLKAFLEQEKPESVIYFQNRELLWETVKNSDLYAIHSSYNPNHYKYFPFYEGVRSLPIEGLPIISEVGYIVRNDYKITPIEQDLINLIMFLHI